MSMDTEDPFATVEPDPLTGTTPEPPPEPSDVLPEGVEPGQLGGTDVVTAEPEPEADPALQPQSQPEAEPEPIEHPDTEPPAFADPAPEESGADDGTPVPAEPEPEVATAVEGESDAAPEPPEGAQNPEPAAEVEQPPPPRSARKKAAAKKAGGAPSRDYFIFEEIKIDLEGQEVSAFVKRRFGNEETITARNGPNALRAAGRAAGDGFEGTLAPVPVSMWNPQPVSTKQKDDLSVSVG